MNLIGEHTDYNGGHVFLARLRWGLTRVWAALTHYQIRSPRRPHPTTPFRQRCIHTHTRELDMTAWTWLTGAVRLVGELCQGRFCVLGGPRFRFSAPAHTRAFTETS